MTNEVVCSAGCKRSTVLTPEGTAPAGWEQLPLSGRFRCMQCFRELDAAQRVTGAPHDPGVDLLPPQSIGALKKLREPPELHEKVKG